MTDRRDAISLGRDAGRGVRVVMDQSVLVVDDDPVIRRLVRRALVREVGGDHLLEAGDLASARKILETRDVSCVILDLGLPDGDGSELLPLLGTEDRPAIVVLTGLGDENHAHQMLRAGVQDFLDKRSVDEPAIRRAVGFAMDRRAAVAALHDEARALDHLSRHDPLTGLLNRRGLDGALGTLEGRTCWGLLVDLDDFKSINDEFGHDVGDAVILAAGRAIARCTRPGDLAARAGGDEFLAVLDTADEGDARTIAERLRVTLAEELGTVATLAHTGRRVTASLGLAPLSPDKHRADAIMGHLTHPLHASKAAGKDRVVVSTAGSPTTPSPAPGSEAALGARDILDLRSGQVVGMEYVATSRISGTPIAAVLDDARRKGQMLELEADLLSRRLDLAGEGAGLVVLPILLAALDTPPVLGRLLTAGRQLGPDRLVVAVWGAPKGRTWASIARTADTLHQAGIGLGVGRLGNGGTPIEALLALRPTLLRVDVEGLGSPGLLQESARLARGLGARVLLAGDPTPETLAAARRAGVSLVTRALRTTDPAIAR